MNKEQIPFGTGSFIGYIMHNAEIFDLAAQDRMAKGTNIVHAAAVEANSPL